MYVKLYCPVFFFFFVQIDVVIVSVFSFVSTLEGLIWKFVINFILFYFILYIFSPF